MFLKTATQAFDADDFLKIVFRLELAGFLQSVNGRKDDIYSLISPRFPRISKNRLNTSLNCLKG